MVSKLKRFLQRQLRTTIESLLEEGVWSLQAIPEIPMERARDPSHGDFASAVALGLARELGARPRAIAEQLVARLPACDRVRKIEVAGPGFINFSLSDSALRAVTADILAAGEAYGRCDLGGGLRVQVEFVSSNPTGPLHVGHGRHAAYGAALANLLEAAGFRMQREYYVNDVGRQMDTLAVSVWLRYLELCGHRVEFPGKGYQGDYIAEIAAEVHADEGDALVVDTAALTRELPPAGATDAQREAYLGALIDGAKRALGSARFDSLFGRVRDAMVADIRDDLEAFGVEFDQWHSEGSMVAGGAIERAMDKLRARGHLFERDGAVWFRTTDFGDEKDRVVIRENGASTYFASDIAYHLEKFERGFDRVIDVWGADHHGYVPRVKAALAAMGRDPDHFGVTLLQFVNLYRDGKRLQMSTRSGQFVTLRELREEVGADAARFFYVSRKGEQHLDFDLDLAVSKSSDNPVYYVQYAHARICSVVRQAEKRRLAPASNQSSIELECLSQEHELALMRTLSRYPEVVESAALAHEPHQIAFYLRDLATDFHGYYNAHTFLVEDRALRDARLALASATRQVIGNGLGILGVSAPQSM